MTGSQECGRLIQAELSVIKTLEDCLICLGLVQLPNDQWRNGASSAGLSTSLAKKFGKEFGELLVLVSRAYLFHP